MRLQFLTRQRVDFHCRRLADAHQANLCFLEVGDYIECRRHHRHHACAGETNWPTRTDLSPMRPSVLALISVDARLTLAASNCAWAFSPCACAWRICACIEFTRSCAASSAARLAATVARDNAA